MQITWDENKRIRNLEKHGYDFADLDMEFFAASTVLASKHNRTMAIGVLRNGVIAVVFARLGKGRLVGDFHAYRQSEGKEDSMTTKHRIKPLTAAEEAKVQRQIASDPDAPEATDEQLAQAKPFAEAFPDLMESIKRARGRPSVEKPRQQVSLRLDPDVIKAFKSTGKGWQGRVNEALRKAAGL